MTKIADKQISKVYRDIVDHELDLYRMTPSVTVRNEIPDTNAIPLDNETHWLKIPDVICVYIDMLGSSRLSVSSHERSTARSYRLFTSTAIEFLHEIGAPYIDIKGDGAFALFNQNQVYRALVAAVNFKTFAEIEFVERVKKDTGQEIGTHIGIAQRNVLVQRMGKRRVDGRTDRQNEVWAGRPVNMAAKLASRTNDGELLVSERFYERLKDQRATHSCGCNGGVDPGTKKPLWKKYDLTDDDRFDFNTAYLLESRWCTLHGKEYSEGLLKEDK